MPIEHALDALSSQVQRILSILADGRRTLLVPEATDWKALALARWEMLRAITSFVADKEAHILDPIIAVAGPAVVARAMALKRENDRLETRYDAFVRRWSLTSPLVVDEAYREEALRMAEEIEHQVVSDVQTLEQLVRSMPPRVRRAAGTKA